MIAVLLQEYRGRLGGERQLYELPLCAVRKQAELGYGCFPVLSSGTYIRRCTSTRGRTIATLDLYQDDLQLPLHFVLPPDDDVVQPVPESLVL